MIFVKIKTSICMLPVIPSSFGNIFLIPLAPREFSSTLDVVWIFNEKIKKNKKERRKKKDTKNKKVGKEFQINFAIISSYFVKASGTRSINTPTFHDVRNMNNHAWVESTRGNRRRNIENVEKYSCALGETTEQVTAAQRVVILTCLLIYHLHFATVLIALVPRLPFSCAERRKNKRRKGTIAYRWSIPRKFVAEEKFKQNSRKNKPWTCF